MRSAPIIITLGYALAGLNAVQATSFVTVTKTVIKDTLVGSVNAASVAPTLVRRSPPGLREDEAEDDPENTFPNPEEDFNPDNGLPEDVMVTDVAMTLKTKGEEFAFTTKLVLEPWPLGPGDLLPVESKSEIDPNEPMVTNKAMTLQTKGEAYVFTTKLTLDAWPDDPADYPQGSTTRRHGEKDEQDTPTKAPDTKPNEPADPTKATTDATQHLSPRSPPDEDTPYYPKTIRKLHPSSPQGPTRDIRITNPLPPFRSPTSILTAIPSDWPHRIGPEEDPLDPNTPIKLPEIVNPEYEEPEPKPTSTFTVQKTAHHFCEVWPYPMSLCTNQSWNREHRLYTLTPPGPPGAVVKRGEVTTTAEDGVVVIAAATTTATATAMITATATATSMATATITGA